MPGRLSAGSDGDSTGADDANSTRLGEADSTGAGEADSRGPGKPDSTGVGEPAVADGETDGVDVAVVPTIGGPDRAARLIPTIATTTSAAAARENLAFGLTLLILHSGRRCGVAGS
jgi:hypothetical protein